MYLSGSCLHLNHSSSLHLTDKELALCLCKLCLNCPLLLDVLNTQGKKDGERVTDSVTEFFMDSSKCEKTENGNYSWKCASGKCKECKLLKPLHLKCSKSAETVKVPQFEETKTPYTEQDKKTGEEKEKISKKVEKVIRERTFEDVYDKLYKRNQKYIMHKYQVYNDKYHWPRILATVTDGPIYHMDYSEI